jgi:Retroviral aspartyl protease
MSAYDSNLFDTPAPIALVSIRDPGSGNTVHDVPMLIDSGSDISLIPRTSIAELELEIDPNAGYELEGFDGRTTVAQAVTLELVFVKRSFGGKYVIVDSGMGILGRDVLNHLAILLDGPHLMWQEHANSAK